MPRLPLLAVACVVLAGCGGGGSGGGGGQSRSSETATKSQRTLRVPTRYETIQKAIDAARNGDTVLISPGEYREGVTVPDGKPGITIRGTNRSKVILDGTRGKLGTGLAIRADGVAVENLTVRHYAGNGLLFSSVEDWRASYVTAYDNGSHGLYARQALNGSFDHVYASGHGAAGIAVAQCRECNARVTDSLAERNAVGFEDTNASGVLVTRSVLRRNRIGALFGSTGKEPLPPQTDGRLSTNEVTGNDNAQTPAAAQGFGAGVVVSGGSQIAIDHNRIAGQPLGVVVTDAGPAAGGFKASNSQVGENTLTRNGYDLVLASAGTSNGNCFVDNRPHRTFPPSIETKTSCGRSVPIPGNAPSFPDQPRGVPYLEIPAPGAQPSMPG